MAKYRLFREKKLKSALNDPKRQQTNFQLKKKLAHFLKFFFFEETHFQKNSKFVLFLLENVSIKSTNGHF